MAEQISNSYIFLFDTEPPKQLLKLTLICLTETAAIALQMKLQGFFYIFMEGVIKIEESI